MQLNAMFPTRDIGNDPAKIRDWAQAAEDLGFAYIEVPDHVFGASARDGWTPLYNEKDPFHETFVLLGFLAAVTKRIRLSSGVLIAPQRQTGLIAKQAAEADLLSAGRFGLVSGWVGTMWSTKRWGRLEDARRPLGRAGGGVATTVVGRFGVVQRPLPRVRGRQLRAAAGAAPDSDLVWRRFRCRGDAGGTSGRWLDADHCAR